MKPSTKMAKEATISFVGMGFGDLVRYVFTMLLARLVGPDYLGIYSLANSITRVAEVFGKVSLDGGVLRSVSMHLGTQNLEGVRRSIGSTLKMGLVFSTLVTVTLTLLSGWFAATVFKAGSLLQAVIAVNALTLPFTVLTQIAASATQGFKLLKYKVFVTGILAPILMLVSTVAFFFMISAEMTIILPSAISALGCFVVMLVYLKKLTGISLVKTLYEKFDPEILRYSVPLMLASGVATLMHWLDIAMLGYFADETTVGLYHPAARTAGVVRAALVALAGIFAPILTEFFAENKLKEMSDAYKLVTRWIMTVSLPFAALITAFPLDFMLLFGAEYAPGAKALVLLTFATLIQSFAGVGAPTLNMAGHPKANLWNYATAVVLNIILNVLWIPRYGITGAACASLCSMIVLELLHSVKVWLLLKLHPFGWKLVKPVIAGIATYTVLFLAKPYLVLLPTSATLGLALLITILVFGFVLWSLRLDLDDREFAKGLAIIMQSFRRK
ncbi:MAG: flippase [bacterium]